MPTIPPVSFDEHIDYLISFLKQSSPTLCGNLKKGRLMFFDSTKIIGYTIGKGVLKSQSEFEPVFCKLCESGLGWINLVGEGWYSKLFLVSVVYSDPIGRSATAVNFSGLRIGIDGKPKENALYNIIDLDNSDGRTQYR
jgi:hypothetical protein